MAIGLYLIQLEDEASFLSLIFEEREGTRILVPGGDGKTRRTLDDVIERLPADGFKSLAEPQGRPSKEHNPEFFACCLKMDEDFKPTERLTLGGSLAPCHRRHRFDRGSSLI